MSLLDPRLEQVHMQAPTPSQRACTNLEVRGVLILFKEDLGMKRFAMARPMVANMMGASVGEAGVRGVRRERKEGGEESARERDCTGQRTMLVMQGEEGGLLGPPAGGRQDPPPTGTYMRGVAMMNAMCKR